MQLSELLFQRVKGLGAQGNLPLQPGYTVVVSATAPVAALVAAALYPAADDQQRLVDGAGPTRIGVGFAGADGQGYRLLRELGGDRQLQKLDPATRKWAGLTKDSLEIESFLRVDCGLLPAEAWRALFFFEPGDLPGARARAAAPSAAPAAVDQERVAALKLELEQTRDFESVQDQLFRVSQRQESLESLASGLTQAEQALQAVERELAKSKFNPEQAKDLLARAERMEPALRSRDQKLQELADHKQRLLDETPGAAESFTKDSRFVGGIVAGLAIDVAAAFLQRPIIAFLGLAAFAVPLYVALEWISADEHDKALEHSLQALKDKELQVKRAFDSEQAPVKAAMKAAGLGKVSELSEMIAARATLEKQREELLAKVEELRQNPEAKSAAAEMEKLDAEKKGLEARVAMQGFARTVAEIEKELKVALGGPATKGTAAAPVNDADVPKLLVTRAAEASGADPAALAAAIAPRLAAYLAALTDKKMLAGKLDGALALQLTAAGGRSGPYAGLSPQLKDQAYLALRLALLERVAAQRKLPVLIDDAFTALEPARRLLLARMLKALGQQTQVLHRQAQPPEQPVADAVVPLQ